jgi:hypothetical protein
MVQELLLLLISKYTFRNSENQNTQKNYLSAVWYTM